MPLKRPVTLAQARRWPAAAKRRESFCARMGGMRELLTGERAARDPGSPINRALAAWDCDKPEGLERKHVSKGVRMKITKAKVGSEARKPAAKNPATKMTPRQQVTRWSKDMGLRASSGDGWVSISDTRSDWSETFDDWSQAMEWARRAYDAKRDDGKPWPWETRKNPAKKQAAPAKKTAPAYAVVKVGMRTPLAVFAKRADAVAFGQSWADIHKTPVRVVAA
jgi:hypothetical protein